MRRTRHRALDTAVAAALLLAAGLVDPSGAAARGGPDFVAVLDAEQTVPFQPNDASGLALFEFRKGGRQLRYRIFLTDLDLDGFVTPATVFDDVTRIHFHEAPPGVVGDHVLNVYKLPRQDDKDLVIRPFKGEVSGRWDDGDENLEGLPSIQLSDALEALCEGNVYVNVHSVDHPLGAVRGQVLPTSDACDRLLDDD